MLIKSECQPLDKTRHKPAWNLFEQREPCKMAREICNAACPLNSCYRRFLQHVRRDRQTDGERDVEESIHLFWWHQASDTHGVNRRARWHDRAPRHSTCALDASIKSPWQSQSWRQDIRTCWNHRACNYGGTKPLWADSLYERASMGKSEQRMLRVGPSVAAHNRSMIKGEFRRQKSSRQVAI